MTDAASGGAGGGGPPPPRSLAARFGAAVDAVNERIGVAAGFAILGVTFAVVYEVVSRGAFGIGTLWSNETTIYLSAVAYLIAGGYALRHKRHVRIDVAHQLLPPRWRARADLVTFAFFVVYAGALTVVGAQLAWTSFLQGESTGSPWNPAIWPVKVAIPLAGALLLLQGIADLARELRGDGRGDAPA